MYMHSAHPYTGEGIIMMKMIMIISSNDFRNMVFDDDKMGEPLMIISIFPVTTLALATLATLVFGQSHKRLESAPSSELGRARRKP